MTMTDLEKAIKGLEETETALKQAVDRGGEMAVMGAFKCYNHVSDALSMLQEQNWISVRDRLPEINQRVLVFAIGKIDGFIGEHTIEICKRFIQRIFPSSPGHEIWSSPYQYFHTDYEITHWMPLPELPKEGR